MKNHLSNGLISRLHQLKQGLEILSHRETKGKFLNEIDGLIGSLERLRSMAMNSSLDEKISDVQRPLEKVLEFLELARNNEAIAILVSSAATNGAAKPKRRPIEISNDLTNEEIRAMLKEDLSRAELKVIAAQRAISFTKFNNDELKQSILKNLDRQEGYARLAIP